MNNLTKENNVSDTLKVEEYNLVDFVMKIQQGIRNGYEVNDSSDDAPIQIGGAFHLIMREAAKPNVVIGKAVFEASLDTTKLQEQLKADGEIEQMLADSLVVEEKTDNSEEVHETSMGTIPACPITDMTEERSQELSDAFVEQLEAKIEEKLSTEEFTELADKASEIISKVDDLLVEAEAKHIEVTTPVKATPKQTRGKKA